MPVSTEGDSQRRRCVECLPRGERLGVSLLFAAVVAGCFEGGWRWWSVTLALDQFVGVVREVPW